MEHVGDNVAVCLCLLFKGKGLKLNWELGLGKKSQQYFLMFLSGRAGPIPSSVLHSPSPPFLVLSLQNIFLMPMTFPSPN